MTSRTRSAAASLQGGAASVVAKADKATPATATLGLSASLRHALPPFNALRAFEAVATHGGIRRAAAALPRDHAAVSRHLRALESWAGVPLIDRGGGLTPEGLRFYTRVCGAMKEIASASLELTHRGNDRRLRLWCVPEVAAQWLAPRLGQFANAYSDIDLELQPTESIPHFSSHQADAVLHYVPDSAPHGSIVDPELRSVVIARPAVLAIASPEFLGRTRSLSRPSDLLQAPLLHESGFDRWERWFAAHSVEVGNSLAGPRLWHGHLTLSAAERGQGVALSNTLLIGDGLRKRALIEVCAGPPLHFGSYVFTARRDRWQDRSILQFRRWLEQSVAGVRSPGKAS